jgi:carbon monoxide dehydrogenase subunit G
MQLSGTVTIKAPRQKVWDFLTDPNQVAPCAPGVESVEIVEPGRKFRAIAAVGFGSVKARFSGDGEFVELEAPSRAKIKAHGNASGSAADVMSEMFLSDTAEGSTEMRWTADIVVLGQLASLAARMMTPVSQKLAEQFFVEVKKKIEN